jgi:hypothetical protein
MSIPRGRLLAPNVVPIRRIVRGCIRRADHGRAFPRPASGSGPRACQRTATDLAAGQPDAALGLPCSHLFPPCPGSLQPVTGPLGVRVRPRSKRSAWCIVACEEVSERKAHAPRGRSRSRAVDVSITDCGCRLRARLRRAIVRLIVPPARSAPHPRSAGCSPTRRLVRPREGRQAPVRAPLPDL